jgi:hypothetical protein
MKELNANIIRQGDVLLNGDKAYTVAKLPDGAIDITPESGRVVLAYGEVTGHAHAIYETKTSDGKPTVRMWSAGAERFLQVLVATTLEHEEHSAPTLQPGIYKLPAQMEYDRAEGLRRVAD